MKRWFSLLAALTVLIGAPMSASAWWNGDWKVRKKIVLDGGPQGADVKDTVGPLPIAIRLHTGNFLFADARPDGSDIRFVADDDKTPLPFRIELFDSVNQLAVIWVQVPRVTPAQPPTAVWLYSSNEKAPSGENSAAVFDAATLLHLDFSEPQGAFKDASAFANSIVATGVTTNAAGWAGAAAVFEGNPLRVSPAPSARPPSGAGAGLTITAWIKPAAVQKAMLFAWGGVTLELVDNQLVARADKASVSATAPAAGEWSQIGLALSDRLVLYVNGAAVGSQPAGPIAPSGDIVLGQGYRGELDAFDLAGTARGADWFKLLAAQGANGHLLTYTEAEATEETGHTGYIAVLFRSLTVDAKVVIAILSVMFAIAIWVMIDKAILIARTGKDNAAFLTAFERSPGAFLSPDADAQRAAPAAPILANSSLLRLHQTAMRELRLRIVERQRKVTAESLAAIKASIDSTLIRENQRLNRSMVLLTIAISGGPFLGLLGTVVGVMITFAAIAAQGDVNINAIAPGIAAALLATVAGLAVAIPSLFGYNYLITRIKAITADMQAFSDEFVSKLAEVHAP